MELSIDQIRTGDRIRKDMGDIKALAESIARHGFLHPVVVMKDHTLVAGARRLEAARLLGLADVPVTVVDVDDLLSAERDENTERKDFTPTEAVAIGRLIEQREAPKVHRDRIEKIRTAMTAIRAGRRGEDEVTLPPSSGRGPQVRDIAAAAVGLSPTTYQRARAVVVAAETSPEKFNDVAASMDATGNITGAFRELERRGGAPKRSAKAAQRHPVHNRTHHPKHNQMVLKAINALEGICLGLESVDLKAIDNDKRGEWSKALSKAAQTISRFARRVNVKAA